MHPPVRYGARMPDSEPDPVERRIVVLGGGGFSEEPDNRLLDDFVLSLTGTPRPKVCFVPTASGDSPVYIERFQTAFPSARAEASTLTLFKDAGVGDIRAHLLAQDVIYVGGGSTVNLLAVWRAHGVDSMMREAWEHGVVLAGISAGMICWFESSVTDSLGGPASPLHDGVGLIEGSACPHFDSEAERKPAYARFVAEGTLPPGYAADDDVALHFVGRELRDVVSSRSRAYAWRLDREGEAAVQRKLPTRCLGA